MDDTAFDYADGDYITDLGGDGGDDDVYIPDDDDCQLIAHGDDDDGDFLIGDDDGDDEAPMDPMDQLENDWLTAKSAEPEEMVQQLEDILKKEEELLGGEKTKFGFKAVRLLATIAFNENRSADVMKLYVKLTTEYKRQLKDSRQPITVLLEKLVDFEDIVKLCDMTLEITNDLKTRVRLMLIKAKGLMKRQDQNKSDDGEIEKCLNEAHNLCKTDGVDNVSHSSSLLDIYALKIQIAEAKGNFKVQKSFFDRSFPLTSAGLASNSVTGAIFRCGGRVRLFDSKYDEASQHFSEAFKNFDECRNGEMADECLKLWVFSSLLSGSRVNLFDDHRAAGYLNKTYIKNFERLTRSCLSKNIEQFNKDIRPAQRDEVVAPYVSALQRLVQKEVFLDLVKPYANISIPFVATKIMATPEETENLLVEMILDGQVNGKIDQNASVVYLRAPLTAVDHYYDHLRNVSHTVTRLQNTVMQAVN